MDVDQVHIRVMRKEDMDAVLSISSSQLGPSYLNETELQNYFTDEFSRIPVLIHNDRLIGYSIIHVVEKSKMDAYSSAPIAEFFSDLKEDEKVQLRKTTAIHPDYSGKGLGRFFIEHTMKEYGTDCRLIISVNWKRGAVIPMRKISSQMGMSESFEIKNYWHDDSITKQYYCPECHEPPCECSAVLFAKKLV